MITILFCTVCLLQILTTVVPCLVLKDVVDLGVLEHFQVAADFLEITVQMELFRLLSVILAGTNNHKQVISNFVNGFHYCVCFTGLLPPFRG